MQHSESSFISGHGKLRIYVQSWLAENSRGSVVIAHGVGEHSGRYAHVAKVLVDAGLSVHALDHRGHGRSEGPRALIDRFPHAVADIHQLVEQVRQENPSQPVFLLGHSMGGALSLSYVLTYGATVSALILSGPAVALDGAPWLLRQVSKLLSWAAPALEVFAVAPELVSRDRSMVDQYATDPLNWHRRIPVRTIAEIVGFVEKLPSRLRHVRLPTLLLHGGDDQLAGVSGSLMIHGGIASQDKTLKLYDGLYHEIFNELPPDRARVLADLAGWIGQHLGARNQTAESDLLRVDWNTG